MFSTLIPMWLEKEQVSKQDSRCCPAGHCGPRAMLFPNVFPATLMTQELGCGVWAPSWWEGRGQKPQKCLCWGRLSHW